MSVLGLGMGFGLSVVVGGCGGGCMFMWVGLLRANGRLFGCGLGWLYVCKSMW